MPKAREIVRSGNSPTHRGAAARASYGLLLLTLGAACTDAVAPGPTAPERASAAIEITSAILEDYFPTPAGFYHKSCVHQIPMRATVDRDRVVHRRDGTTYRLPTCRFAPRSTIPGHAQAPFEGPPAAAAKPPTINDWVEFTDASSSGFKRIVADWRVPPSPQVSYSTPGKVYYTFPGLTSDAYIIQPVLQYGNSGFYGGAYWTIASWRCDTGTDCQHSLPITVSSGDLIHGDVSASNCADGMCTWSITTTNSSTGQSTTWSVQDTENYSRAHSGAVEVYGLSYCTEFPAHADYTKSGVFYSNVSVLDRAFNPVSPNWSNIITSNLIPQCNYRVTSSATAANLYHAPAVTASITGPTDIYRFQSAQYTATPLYGTSPWLYQWRVRHSPDGFSWGAWSPWSSPSTQNYTYTSVNSCGIRRVHLQSMVTDAEARTGTGDYYISVIDPC